MQKIISLFKRDYQGNWQIYNEVVPGAEWVLSGAGQATEKYDGTGCMIRASALFKRHDRKLTKPNARRKKRDKSYRPTPDDFKPAPPSWEAAEANPNIHTGHWPGWARVFSDNPADKWHVEALSLQDGLQDGSYELVGPKVQSNPYGLKHHLFWRHGGNHIDAPRSFDELREWFADMVNGTFTAEGIVWHHSDGRMVKIKRRDFGMSWPMAKKELVYDKQPL